MTWRYESKNGKHWVGVEINDDGVSYTSPSAMGYGGNVDIPAAIDRYLAMIADGYFLPDSYKTAMERTA